MRAEIKVVDNAEGGYTTYQYSDDGKNWFVKRPDCNTQDQTTKLTRIAIRDIINGAGNEPIKNYKQDYSELLNHPKWQRKRLEIMQRDDFKCRLCGDDETTLHIHHKEYINGNKPWEYEESYLITLCEHCHRAVEFYKKNGEDLTDEKSFKVRSSENKSELQIFITIKGGLLLFYVSPDEANHVLRIGEKTTKLLRKFIEKNSNNSLNEPPFS